MNRLSEFNRRLLLAIHNGAIQPGDLAHVTVCHDRECRLMAGTGVCDCDPAITLSSGGRLWEIDRDGRARRVEAH
jgi:hypothetical protein